MTNIETKVEDLINPYIRDLGYDLYDVEYVKERKRLFLRIYIDKETGIDLNDCEKVSNAINDILDEADYIKEQYFLEVSSPGIERVIRKDKHLEQNIGKEIEIKLFKALDNSKILQGILTKFDENKIYIQTEKEEKEIDRNQIAQIKTKYNW